MSRENEGRISLSFVVLPAPLLSLSTSYPVVRLGGERTGPVRLRNSGYTVMRKCQVPLFHSNWCLADGIKG